MTQKSGAAVLFNAEIPNFPDMYIYIELEGKKQLRKITVEGSELEGISVNIGKRPYNLRECQSIEMALNALHQGFSHYQDKNPGLPRKKVPMEETTIESLLSEVPISENHAAVYVLTLNKFKPLHDQEKLYAFLAQLKRLKMPIEKGAMWAAYKRAEVIESTPHERMHYPMFAER